MEISNKDICRILRRLDNVYKLNASIDDEIDIVVSILGKTLKSLKSQRGEQERNQK